MSLDITFRLERKLRCPHCGETVRWEIILVEESDGRRWYPPLAQIGYYVPHEQRTEENDWYGKDMVLTDGQRDQMKAYVSDTPRVLLYRAEAILALLERSYSPGYRVVVNADW